MHRYLTWEWWKSWFIDFKTSCLTISAVALLLAASFLILALVRKILEELF